MARDKLFLRILLLLLFAVVLLDLGWELSGRELPGRPVEREVGNVAWSEIRDGRATSKLETRHKNHSLVGRLLMGPYNELVYRFLGRPSPSARVFEPPWIFADDRSRDIEEAQLRRLIRENTKRIKDVSELVKASGGDLLLVLIPDRARLYPEFAYWNGEMPRGREGYLPRLARALERAGIPSLDLTDALMDLKKKGVLVAHQSDHHWSSPAAQEAARLIALRIAPLLPPHTHTEPFDVQWELDHSEETLVKNLGFVPYSKLENQFRVPVPRAYADGVKSKKAIKKREKRPEKWEKVCASYWTTSFGRLGAPQFLANEIGCPLRTQVGAGKGSAYGPAKDLKRLSKGIEKWKKTHPGSGAHVVVWLIPEYHTLAMDGLPVYLKKLDRILKRARKKRKSGP